ncbi:MAG: hypothetical protein OXI91_00735 [Chloroflexota bacterium]|nr:hypothetical protein [Chloroflexota bacterium]
MRADTEARLIDVRASIDNMQVTNSDEYMKIGREARLHIVRRCVRIVSNG